MLVTVVVGQRQRGVGTLSFHDNIGGIRPPAEVESRALLRGLNLYGRPSIWANQAKEHRFWKYLSVLRNGTVSHTCRASRFYLYGRSNFSMSINDFERTAAKHRRDAIRLHWADLGQQENQNSHIDQSQESRNALGIHRFLLI